MAVFYDKTKVIIEMQVGIIAAFDKRVVFNITKTDANQLGTGEGYMSSRQVIALTITDFIMFKETRKVVTKFAFKEEEEFFNYKAAELSLIFVELPKFKKTLSKLKVLRYLVCYSGIEKASKISLCKALANRASQ